MSEFWIPPIAHSRRISGRIIRAGTAGVIDLPAAHRALLVEGICARFLSSKTRLAIGALWAMYGPTIHAAAAYRDTTRTDTGVDEDLDSKCRSRPQPRS